MSCLISFFCCPCRYVKPVTSPTASNKKVNVSEAVVHNVSMKSLHENTTPSHSRTWTWNANEGKMRYDVEELKI